MDTAAKPQRADARRNREKIVTAAREAFAEYGPATQMDDVAQRAGVGVGTLYRHFPTKDALVRAIVESQMERTAAEGRRRLDAGGDAWEAFAAFIRHAGLFDHALAHVMSVQPPEMFRDVARETGLIAVAAELLERAQDAGAARRDARVDDVPMVMCGLGAVLRSWGEDTGMRYLELVLDGLRACDARPLPGFRES